MQAQLYLSYECRSHCSECKKQNGNYCAACGNNLYLSEGACSSSCSSNLGYDFIDGKKACINCKATYGQYVDNNKCTDMIKGKFAYPDSKYGVLYHVTQIAHLVEIKPQIVNLVLMVYMF